MMREESDCSDVSFQALREIILNVNKNVNKSKNKKASIAVSSKKFLGSNPLPTHPLILWLGVRTLHTPSWTLLASCLTLRGTLGVRRRKKGLAFFLQTSSLFPVFFVFACVYPSNTTGLGRWLSFPSWVPGNQYANPVHPEKSLSVTTTSACLN